MLNPKEITPKAIKILCKYNILAATYELDSHPLSQGEQEYLEKYRTPPESLKYLKELGLAFDPITMTHDEALAACFKQFEKCEKKPFTTAFLASLSTNRLDYRSGLSAFAIMKTMPKHKFSSKTDFCEICSGNEIRTHLDLTGLNQQRFDSGSMFLFKDPYVIQFFLEQQLLLVPISPVTLDFTIFNKIIALITNAAANETPSEIAKKINKISEFKTTLHQSRMILEVLGYCSILETEQHKGYLSKFTDPGRAPSKTRSSDWAYPVDFWTGKDGINREAFDFWFSDYKEIKGP